MKQAFSSEGRPRLLSRRELISKGLKLLFAAGSFHFVYSFAGWAGGPPSAVSFEDEPGEGEAIFKEGVFLVGLPEGPAALSARCPHLGCRLGFHEKEGRFECPCHGSRFTLQGERIDGPAARGMTRLSLARDAGRKILKATREVT